MFLLSLDNTVHNKDNDNRYGIQSAGDKDSISQIARQRPHLVERSGKMRLTTIVMKEKKEQEKKRMMTMKTRMMTRKRQSRKADCQSLGAEDACLQEQHIVVLSLHKRE